MQCATLYSVRCIYIQYTHSITDHSYSEENMRPEIPIVNQKWAPMFAEIMRACWRRDPVGRPSFAKVVQDFQRLRQFAGGNLVDSPHLPLHELIEERRSPDMHPVPLPPLPREYTIDVRRRRD